MLAFYAGILAGKDSLTVLRAKKRAKRQRQKMVQTFAADSECRGQSSAPSAKRGGLRKRFGYLPKICTLLSLLAALIWVLAMFL